VTTNEPIQTYRKTSVGSDRNFGILFAAVFALIALAPLYHGGPVRWWAVPICLLFLASAMFTPGLLRPLNRLWFRFGLVLHHVVNPVVMALLYYGAVVPTGLLVRTAGKDLLRLKFDKTAASYWISREQPAPPPGGMTKQF
jgi:hypothetical protein